MVPIARRNLLAEKARLGVAVGGVAFSVFLIVLIQSLFLGFRQSAGALVEDLPFELWVLQEGSFDLYHSTSLPPPPPPPAPPPASPGSRAWPPPSGWWGASCACPSAATMSASSCLPSTSP